MTRSTCRQPRPSADQPHSFALQSAANVVRLGLGKLTHPKVDGVEVNLERLGVT